MRTKPRKATNQCAPDAHNAQPCFESSASCNAGQSKDGAAPQRPELRPTVPLTASSSSAQDSPRRASPTPIHLSERTRGDDAVWEHTDFGVLGLRNKVPLRGETRGAVCDSGNALIILPACRVQVNCSSWLSCCVRSAVA
jgi:hypothetical protein